MSDKKDITCVDCYVALSEIKVTINLLRGDLMKILYVMLGMIGAQIGVKYLGTPWHLYIMVYVSIITTVFLLASTLFSWRAIPRLWRGLGFSLAMLFGFSSGIRLLCYSKMIPLPKEAGVVVQALYVLCGTLVVIIFWRNGRWDGEDRRGPP